MVGVVCIWQWQSSEEDLHFSSRAESGPLRLNRNIGLMNDWKQRPKLLPHVQEGGVASEQQLIESTWPRRGLLMSQSFSATAFQELALGGRSW